MGGKTKKLMMAMLLCITMLTATATPAQAETQRYPYTTCETRGGFACEKAKISFVLLECADRPGRYWTMKSDGWLGLDSLKEDPLNAGQVFMFMRNETHKGPQYPYGTEYVRNEWMTVATQTDPVRWLTTTPEGYYFKEKMYHEGDGIQEMPQQQFRLKVIENCSGGKQIIRVVARAGDLAVAGAGHSLAIPHQYI